MNIHYYFTKKNSERGFFIGIILLVSFLILALSISMHHQLGSVTKGVKNNEQGLQLEWVARSGLEASVARLREDNDLDGPQPEMEIPDMPGAVYESVIFNNLKGQKDELNPEAPGALSPDGRAWVANGAVYIQVIASLKQADGTTELVQAAASGVAGYGGYSFNSGVLANTNLTTEDSEFAYYDKNYANGTVTPFNKDQDTVVVDDTTDGIIKVNQELKLKGRMNVSGSIQVFESDFGRVDRGELHSLSGDRVSDQAITPTRKKGFIPKAIVPTGLKEASMYVSGQSFDIRSLYPSRVDGMALNGGLLRLSGNTYYINGDVVLARLALEAFGNLGEPVTLIIDGNVAFDGVRANYYGAGIPGDPLALKILIRENSRFTIRNSQVSAVVCAAEGTVKIDGSDVFGLVAANNITTKGSRFFVPTGDLKVNIPLMGEIETYQTHDSSVFKGEKISFEQAFKTNAQDNGKKDLLAENHGFSPEPPMPRTDNSSLTAPPESLTSNPTEPKPLGGNKWDFAPTPELLSAPESGEVPLFKDRVGGIPVTIYDPPPNAVRSCFPAGTTVQTSEGERPIEELNIGDLIVTYSDRMPIHLSFQSESLRGLGSAHYVSPIEKVFVHPGSKIGTVQLRRLRDGLETQLEVTREHIVYSVNLGDWCPIGSLPEGSQLQSPTGLVEIVGAWTFQRTGTTYNFELAEHHTYCVGDLAVWVHNYKEPVIRPPSDDNDNNDDDEEDIEDFDPFSWIQDLGE